MKEVSKNIHKHMQKLCIDIGSKHCGSPELNKAGAYIAHELKEEGYQIIIEEFTVRGWNFQSFHLYNMTQHCDVPASTACYFSNSVDIYDVPIWIDWKDIYNLDNLAVKDRLCFIAAWYDDQDKKVFGYNSIAEKLDELGAAAAIFLNRPPHTQCAPSTKIERSPFLNHLAVAAVAQEGAIFMANHQCDLYHLKIEAECYDTTAYNIIARIGYGPRKGVVGAHYDTAPLIQGAQDNIGGIAILLEMARILKKDVECIQDEWTIDFVAFSGEEYIATNLPLGSGDYVHRHCNENIKWFLNIDDVAPYYAYPEIEISNANKLPLLDFPYASKLSELSGDDKSFYAIGVPTIWIVARKLFSELHTSLDNLAHTDFDRMVAVTKEYIELFRQLIDVRRWNILEKPLTDGRLRIIPTTPAHYERVAELAVDAWEEIYRGYRKQLGYELFEAFFKDRINKKKNNVITEAQTGNSFVAMIGSKIVAFINFDCQGILGEIKTNAVDPVFRGKGLGTMLQKYVMERMKEKGCTYVFVETGGDDAHLPARNSYQKNGFSVSIPSVKYFKKL